MPGLKTVQRDWARIGAKTRLLAIEQERQAILKAFPELRRGGAVAGSSIGRPKRQFSAAARRRMSAGMRKYWARRRAAGKMKNKTS